MQQRIPKILIISSDTGGGHRSAVTAIVAGVQKFLDSESYAIRVVRAVEESHHLSAKLVRNVEVDRQAGWEEEVYVEAECGHDGSEEDPCVAAGEEFSVQPWEALLVVPFPLPWAAFQVEDRDRQTYSLDQTVEVPFGSFSPFPSVAAHVLA